MELTSVLVGAGGFGRELICWAEDAHAVNGFPKLSGFLDDNPYALNGFAYDIPYLGRVNDYSCRENTVLLCGIADPNIKKQVVLDLLSRGCVFTSLVHPSAVVAKSAQLGRGVIICPNSLISADAKVGDYVAINALSSVGHDVSIGEFTTLSAHVDITGGVQVGCKVFFGTGAKLVPRISIGDEAKIGAGAIVMRSVTSGTTVFASPARRL